MSDKKIWDVFDELTKDLSSKEKEIINSETGIRDNIALAMVKLREKAGLSQKEVAKILNVSQSWVSRLENSNYDHRIESIWKYLTALNSKPSLVVTLETNNTSYRAIIDENKINIQKDEEYKIKFTFNNISEDENDIELTEELNTVAS